MQIDEKKSPSRVFRLWNFGKGLVKQEETRRAEKVLVGEGKNGTVPGEKGRREDGRS